MDAEVEALIERDSWELVELPAQHRSVGVKRVLNIKINADGSLGQVSADGRIQCMVQNTKHLGPVCSSTIDW